MQYKVKRFSVLRQRIYGMGDVAEAVGNGARDLTGNVVEGTGKALDSGLGKTAGAAVGLANMGTAAGAGAAIGSALMPGIGTAVGGALGALSAPFLGAKAAETAGKVLKSTGQDIHS